MRTPSCSIITVAAAAAFLSATSAVAFDRLAAQDPDDLLDVVNFYHAHATSDLNHIHQATSRFESLAINSPPDESDPESWLPAYWTSFAYTQLSMFADDDRSGPYAELARHYYEQALAAKPEGNAGTDADFFALEGMVLSFEGRQDGSQAPSTPEAWANARAADPDNPMVLMNGGLAMIAREDTRDQAYELLDRAIEMYEPRLGSVRPNWGREFIDVWMGSYPRRDGGESTSLLAVPEDDWTVVRDEGSRGDPARLDASNGSLSVRTGASSVLYRPDISLSGVFRLEATIEQSDPERRNEGYGIIFGMRPAASGWSYDYLLIRQDGQVLLKRREGDTTATLRDWTEEPALHAWATRPTGSTSISNTLAVDATREVVRVVINGVVIHEEPRDRLHVDGLVGLRVNHGLSIRVTDFQIDQGPTSTTPGGAHPATTSDTPSA